MSEVKLHPDVKKFKAFVEKHPKIIREARSGKHDLNYYFKHYQKYGETDSFWDQFTENDNKETLETKKDNKKSWTEQLKGLVNKFEFDQIDQHLKQADSAISELKNLLEHFSEIRGHQKQTSQPPHPPQLQQPPQLPQPPMSRMNRRLF